MILAQITEWISQNKEIAAALVTAAFSGLGFLITRLLTAKPRIDWHAFPMDFFNVQPPAGPAVSIRTQHCVIMNTGRAPARNLEIALNYPPEHIDVWPHIYYETKSLPKARTILFFERLNPRDMIRISMLDSRIDIPSITSVRWEGGIGRFIQLQFVRAISRWRTFSILTLAAVGFFSVSYVMVRFLIGFI